MMISSGPWRQQESASCRTILIINRDLIAKADSSLAPRKRRGAQSTAGGGLGMTTGLFHASWFGRREIRRRWPPPNDHAWPAWLIDTPGCGRSGAGGE